MQSRLLILAMGIMLAGVGAEVISQGEVDNQGLNSVEVAFALIIIIGALALAIYFIFRSPGSGNDK